MEMYHSVCKTPCVNTSDLQASINGPYIFLCHHKTDSDVNGTFDGYRDRSVLSSFSCLSYVFQTNTTTAVSIGTFYADYTLVRNLFFLLTTCDVFFFCFFTLDASLHTDPLSDDNYNYTVLATSVNKTASRRHHDVRRPIYIRFSIVVINEACAHRVILSRMRLYEKKNPFSQDNN